jgi:integrase
MRLFNTKELSHVLQIKSTTINELVGKGKIPYTKLHTVSGEVVRFVPLKIKTWLRSKPNINMDDKKYLTRFKTEINKESASMIKELKEIDKHFSECKENKGFYLVKVNSKEYGFLYYARFIKDGKLVPTKRCTHTNNRDAAERWAVENRNKVLDEYYNRDIVKKKYSDLYTILRKYYSSNSPYLEIDIKRGRELNNDSRETYHNFILHQFIPFLRKKKIKSITDIDVPLLAQFQNWLLIDRNVNGKKVLGNKPQTVNRNMSVISLIFDHLLIEGQIKINPCKSLVCLKSNGEQIRGCYEITKLKGAFNKVWNEQLPYLLCLLIYSTGMRNSEIERIKLKHIISIDKVRFIDIVKSKTKNGIRLVPLHDFVYRKIMAYIKKNDKDENDFIFKKNNVKYLGSEIYDLANMELAKHTKYTKAQLQKENITFYSGRHFWKTLMDSENLGEIEEYFMGHKVTADVAKRYNHRDKQGRKKLLERAKKVFQVLEKYVFIRY